MKTPSPWTRRHFIASTGAALVASQLVQAGTAIAAELPEPAHPAILTVTGRIAVTNQEGAAQFDLSMLDALPQHDVVTATPWHEGRPTFRGPLLADVLNAVGASGEMLHITALNDYSTDLPVSDAKTIPVILATRIDGQEIPVRDKGPIFVIYPFDDRPDLFNEIYFNRSIWQVASIEVTG